MQRNHITQIEYTKSNATTLEEAKVSNGFTSDEWLTFIQAKESNRQIIKGSKGIRLVRVFDTDKTDTAGKAKKAIKGFTLFNLNQTEIIK